MADLLDQSTNYPLLNTSTTPPQSLTDLSSTLESSETKVHDLGSHRGGIDNDSFQHLFPDDTTWSVASITGGLVVAFVLALWHHSVLEYLHGRNIADFSQRWIKGTGNGFANIFSICVAFSASSALTQMKWRISGREPLPMYTTDNVFALPAPLAVVKTLVRPRCSLFLPILASILIQTLVIVSILAPSALSIALNEQAQDIQVPTLDLASLQGQFASSTYEVSGHINDPSANVTLMRLDITSAAEKTIDGILLSLPDIRWNNPASCGSKCSFYLEYDAPLLECNYTIQQLEYRPVDLGRTIYEANTSLYPAFSPGQQWDTPYDLSINYTTQGPTTATFGTDLTAQSYATFGTYCRFRWGTYNASFALTNNGTSLVETSVISRSDYLSLRDIYTSTPSDDGILGTWAVCYAFATAIRGRFSQNGTLGSGDLLPRVLLPPFDFADLLREAPAWTDFNLSQSLVDMFSNLTLSLISTPYSENNRIDVSAVVWDGTNVWVYTTWVLWASYLPALLLAIPVAVYGLRSIHASGIGMGDNFSTFLLATRNPELDEICKEAADFEDFQRYRLIHRERGTFSVDHHLKSN